MSEKLKLNDFEISMLIIERDMAQFKAQRIDEVLNKLGEAQGFINADKKEVAPSSSSPSATALPGEDFASLPWKSYATKQDAKPEEAAWCFANTKGAEVLLATLKAKEKVQIASMEYSFSGNIHQFISRKPVKK